MAQNDFDTLRGYFIEDLKVGQKAELKKRLQKTIFNNLQN